MLVEVVLEDQIPIIWYCKTPSSPEGLADVSSKCNQSIVAISLDRYPVGSMYPYSN